jgi:hypothetical protein
LIQPCEITEYTDNILDKVLKLMAIRSIGSRGSMTANCGREGRIKLLICKKGDSAAPLEGQSRLQGQNISIFAGVPANNGGETVTSETTPT